MLRMRICLIRKDRCMIAGPDSRVKGTQPCARHPPLQLHVPLTLPPSFALGHPPTHILLQGGTLPLLPLYSVVVFVDLCSMTHTDSSALEAEYISRHHCHEPLQHQASAVLSKRIRAPVDVVWSTVRKFDEPQQYKTFVKSCKMHGDVQPGNVREVCVISGLPATTSTEMLEILDDEQHIMSYRVVGGDHRLHNYKSKLTLHSEVIDSKPGTLILESFSVDVPEGNTKEDATFFVQALIKSNLKNLADICEKRRKSVSPDVLTR